MPPITFKCDLHAQVGVESVQTGPNYLGQLNGNIPDGWIDGDCHLLTCSLQSK